MGVETKWIPISIREVYLLDKDIFDSITKKGIEINTTKMKLVKQEINVIKDKNETRTIF